MYIIAIDPGGTTGLALRKPDGDWVTLKVQTQEDLWDFFVPSAPKPDYVVLEEWQFNDGIARPEGVLTHSLVSSIRGICYVSGVPLALRTPASRYKHLREATELYIGRRGSKSKTFTKFESHEIDALAHLLTFEAQYAGREDIRR